MSKLSVIIGTLLVCPYLSFGLELEERRTLAQIVENGTKQIYEEIYKHLLENTQNMCIVQVIDKKFVLFPKECAVVQTGTTGSMRINSFKTDSVKLPKEEFGRLERTVDIAGNSALSGLYQDIVREYLIPNDFGVATCLAPMMRLQMLGFQLDLIRTTKSKNHVVIPSSQDVLDRILETDPKLGQNSIIVDVCGVEITVKRRGVAAQQGHLGATINRSGELSVTLCSDEFDPFFRKIRTSQSKPSLFSPRSDLDEPQSPKYDRGAIDIVYDARTNLAL